MWFAGLKVLLPVLGLGTVAVACMGQDPGGPLTDLKKPKPTPTQGAGEVVLKFPIKAQLSNTPPEVTAALEYEVKVSGEGIVSYLHDVVEGRKCDTASFPSQPVAIGIPVKGAISKDGEHSLCVKGVDSIGRIQDVATSFLWKVDRLAPTVTLSNPPKDFSTEPTVVSGANGLNVVAYAWSVNEGKLSSADCATKQYSEFISLSEEFRTSPAKDGDHTICVKGKSPSGVEGVPAAYTWIQDRNAPGVVFELPNLTGAIPFTVSFKPENRAQSVAVWVTDQSNCGSRPVGVPARLFEDSGVVTFDVTVADLKQNDCSGGTCSSGIKKRRLCFEASKQGLAEVRKATGEKVWDVDLSNPILTVRVKDSSRRDITNKCDVSKTAMVIGNSTKCPSKTAALLLDISTPEEQPNSAQNLRYRTRFVAEGSMCPSDENGWSDWMDGNRLNFPLANLPVSALPANPGKYSLCTQVQHSLKRLNAGAQTVWLDKVSATVNRAVSTNTTKLNAQVNEKYRYSLLDGATACSVQDLMSRSLREPTILISDALGVASGKFFKLCLLGEGQTVPTELVFFVDNVKPSLKIAEPKEFNNASTVKLEFEAAPSGEKYNAALDALKYALVNYDAVQKKCLPAPAQFVDLANGKGSVDVSLADAEKNTLVRRCLYARDSSNNTGFAQLVEWTHDSNAPGVPTVTGALPTKDGRDGRAELTNLAIGGADVVNARSIIVEGANCPAALPASGMGVNGLNVASIKLPNLNNTIKTLCVYGLDRAENFSVYRLSWTFDSTAPALSLSGVPNDEKLTATKSVSITISSTEPMVSALEVYEEVSPINNYRSYCEGKLKQATLSTTLAQSRSRTFQIAVPTAAVVYKIVCAAGRDAQGNVAYAGAGWKVSK